MITFQKHSDFMGLFSSYNYNYLKACNCYTRFDLLSIRGYQFVLRSMDYQDKILIVLNDDIITLAIKTKNQEGKCGAWYQKEPYQIFLRYAFRQVTF